MKTLDIPKEVVEEMMKQVHEHEIYKKLMKKKNSCIRTGLYAKAMQISQQMKDIENECLKTYIDMWEGETKKVTDLVTDMTDEDKDYMSAVGNALVMVSDVLETLSIEANQKLKQYHPTFRIEMFDKLLELAKEAQKHVRMLDDYKSDEFYTNLYGDTTDKLTEMVINKAKSFVAKVKKHEESVNKKVKRNAKMA